MARNASRTDKTNCECNENRICTHCAGKQEVKGHKEGEECGNTGKESDDEPEPDGELADNDGI